MRTTLGRFGGAELSYASDLDVIVVYRGTTTPAFEVAEETGTALLRFIGGSTPAGRDFPAICGRSATDGCNHLEFAATP